MVLWFLSSVNVLGIDLRRPERLPGPAAFSRVCFVKSGQASVHILGTIGAPLSNRGQGQLMASRAFFLLGTWFPATFKQRVVCRESLHKGEGVQYR